MAWENGLEACRKRSRPDEGLLLQSRQEILAIRLGWWQQRFRAAVRIETYIGDGMTFLAGQ